MGWECHWVWRNVCFSYRHFTCPVTPCPPRARLIFSKAATRTGPLCGGFALGRCCPVLVAALPLWAAVVYTGTIHEFTTFAAPTNRSQIRFVPRETVFLLWRLRLFPAGKPSKSAARRAGRLGHIWPERFRVASDHWQSPALRPAGTGAGQFLRR